MKSFIAKLLFPIARLVLNQYIHDRPVLAVPFMIELETFIDERFSEADKKLLVEEWVKVKNGLVKQK